MSAGTSTCLIKRLRWFGRLDPTALCSAREGSLQCAGDKYEREREKALYFLIHVESYNLDLARPSTEK